MTPDGFEFDKIGYWSELKLEIIEKYASAYTKIVSKKFKTIYIDGFSGAGQHISKSSGELVDGSPMKALGVQPPFDRLFFVDLNGGKAQHLKEMTASNENVEVFTGDCNKVLLEQVFPRVSYNRYERSLCVLDPYGLHLSWEVMFAAAKTGAIEFFLNFPIQDMNRNVIWRNPEKASSDQRARLTSFWGDESWRKIAYKEDVDLFGTFEEKQPNEVVVEAFRDRLRKVAKFDFVPDPLPMVNTKGAVVYYLFFASHNKTAGNIISDIFEKYRSTK